MLYRSAVKLQNSQAVNFEMTETLEILEKLVGFNTISANSNIGLIQYVEDYLKLLGFRITRIPTSDGKKAGLYAEIGPTGDGILLSAHTDVVPTQGQMWTRDPFKLTQDNGRVYGRGTTDMKGYVASVLSVAGRAAKTDLNQPLKIILSYDEEIGCVGIQQMLERLTPLIGHPQVCFVGEPTEMQVAVGHKGKAALKAICRGQSGHSALAPTFVNAIHLASEFVLKLQILQNNLKESGARDQAYAIPYSTFHVGLIQSGVALNIVPDHAELTFEYRHLVADEAAYLLTKINTAAKEVEERYQRAWSGASIAINQYNAYPGLDIHPKDSVIAYAQKLACRKNTTKVSFGTEAGFFDELGIPTVVCGPGSMSGQGHKPDEYVSMEQLAQCDAMMDRILDDLQV